MYFSLMKINCPYCGKIHRMNKEGICPHCRRRYILTDTPQKKEKKDSKLKRAFSEIADFISSSGAGQRRLVLLLTFSMLALLVLFISATVNLANLEADEYAVGEHSFVPVIYKAGNTVHCLFEGGKTVELGVGEVLKYDSSRDGNMMYLLFSGRISSDVDSANAGDYVVRIEDKRSLNIVAKGTTGRVSYVAGGDCEYAYVVFPTIRQTTAENEAEQTPQPVQAPTRQKVGINGASTRQPVAQGASQAQTADSDTQAEQVEKEPAPSPVVVNSFDGYSIYLCKGKKQRILVSEIATSSFICTSPNGRYLLFCTDDVEGSELTKYRASKHTFVETGVKNAHPVSIDNKGKYFSYFKTDAEGKNNFSHCTSSEDSTPYSLGTQTINEIVFSSDMKKLAILTDGYAVYKSTDSNEYRQISFDTSSDFGLVRNENINTSNTDGKLVKRISILKTDLFPYFYYDAPNKTVYRISANGARVPHFDVPVDQAVINESGDIAFISDSVLYKGRLEDKKSKKQRVLDGISHTLYDISPDGNTVFCVDKADARVYEISLSSGEMSPLTENTSFIRMSPDSKAMFYTKGNDAYLKRSAGTPRLIDSNIIADMTCMLTNDFSQFVYAKNMGVDSDGVQRISLYIYRDGKPMFVTENLSGFITQRHAVFTESRSKHFNAGEGSQGGGMPSLLTGENADNQ